MAEDDDRSVTSRLSLPKRRTFSKTYDGVTKKVETRKTNIRSKEICRQSASQPALQKYTLPGEQPLPYNVVKRKELLLLVRRFLKTQEKNKCNKRLTIALKEKHKIVSINLRQRLQPISPMIDDVRTVQDIDPYFFQVADDRPLVHRIPMFKTLKTFFDQHQRLRHEIGYRLDCIMNIEVNYRNELKQYDVSVKNCRKQAKYYDQFISEDYLKSMKLLNEWEHLKVELDKKRLELEEWASAKFSIMSRLIGLESKYRVQQKYGRFLYYLSPPSWRAQNRDFAHSTEIENMGFDLGCADGDDAFSVIFESLQKECCTSLVKPCLYFSNPAVLVDGFERFQQQQLHHFSHVTVLATHVESSKKLIKILRAEIQYESQDVTHSIAVIKSQFKYYEDRSDELETKFFRILHGLFYDCVASPEVLKLLGHLEFSYERIKGEKPINFDLLSMAKFLEGFYMDYTERLDAIHNDSVKKAVTRCLKEERKKMRLAHVASRELRLFNRLEHNLRITTRPYVKNAKAFTPEPQPYYRKPPKNKLTEKTKIAKKTQRALTEAEIEYLVCYTDWNEGEDPTLYLHSVDE